MHSSSLQVRHLGLTTYTDGLIAQDEAASVLSSSRPNEVIPKSIVIVTEHHPCITLGRRGHIEADLLWNSERLRERGIEIVHTERGGQATLHSPGQLVIYPITRVRDRGVRVFVDAVQACTQDALAQMGLRTELGSEPGLFVDQAKLVAFGFQISSGISRHGLAINVQNDVSMFESIRVCGQTAAKVTSLKLLGGPTDLRQVAAVWVNAWTKALLKL
ncbi:MAG TPA: lipoyl(octanoyl) transferase LipB [Pseudobdellovibrionaceae bacterium]|nr:lipoyl(octanoyl) transferase LipB [Pseudobdellovibrionaceae bacterium]